MFSWLFRKREQKEEPLALEERLLNAARTNEERELIALLIRPLTQLKENRTVRDCVRQTKGLEEARELFKEKVAKHEEENKEWLFWDPWLLHYAFWDLFLEKEQNFGVLLPDEFAHAGL